ncbi:MAG: hypothetical protein HWE14_08415 [Flavobacteriia bacterium]|nr:hypothetical protein [Flavobacteriia bacterium]
MNTFNKIIRNTLAVSLVVLVSTSCTHETETLSYVTAGQYRGMDVFTVNDSLEWDKQYTFRTFEYEGHDLKIEVSSPVNSPGSGIREDIRIWGEGGLEFGVNNLDYGLGIDTSLSTSFTFDGTNWVGSIFYDYICNAQYPIGYTRSFYTYEKGERIDLDREWHQPKNQSILHLPSTSTAPQGTDTTRTDTLLYIYKDWGAPSCGHGIQSKKEGYFMLKVTRGSDIHLGWMKYRFKGNSWPNGHMLYIDSWAISSKPIEQ